MSRKPPENLNHEKLLPPDVTKQSGASERIMKLGQKETKIIVQTRHYTLITPLFGGGVKPHENDLDNLIRSTEIRGQLRFWWRAIRGGQPDFEGKLDKMKDREDEIWGAASNTNQSKDGNSKSPGEDKEKVRKEAVQIEVEVTKKGQAVKPFSPFINNKGKPDLASHKDVPDYASFPLRPPEERLRKDREKTHVDDLRQDIHFTLTIACSERWSDDVEAALWAWETFGGVGARTRRGFGALLLQKIDANEIKDGALPPSNSDEAKVWIRGKLLQYLDAHEEKLTHVPHIGIEFARNMRVLGPYLQSANAWKKLIDSLFAFRQQRFDFRQQRPSPYGKSLWPEANALRQYLHKNQQKTDTPNKFPRAAFGLPIVFHLPHEKPVTSITLQGTKDAGERFASRLILKPIPCRDKKFLGIAILLDGSQWPEEDLALMRDGKPWKTISVEQTQLKPRELPNLDHVLGAENDVLKAFLDYLKPEER